ncbi:nucleoporin complex subunit 54-domain-containing protein [Hygrophoropsis aurantiaca]|uniref:Nucleoporin complex subunit 54-domain-containing protein n=1 Tax=Hygrophoropsis aurantiaca TaxID=72124 RepID=A0ACB8ACH1_9AGAM|nr:nucleoporin complex subunit 54-domain-containing protein [Hygrophoropsis aurantiaca]
MFGAFGGQNQTSSNPFGNTNTQQQGQNPATGTSLFGNTAQPQAGTSLFGNTTQPAQNGTPAFGQTGGNAAGTNLFGGSTINQGGTGLFGNPNTHQQQQQPATGGLFGNTSNQQQPAATSLFGGTSNQTQQQPATGSMFGNTNQQQQPAAGNLFGSTNTQQQPAGGSLFGTTNQQQPQQQTGGLFGNSTAQQPQQSGSLFGSTTAQPPSTGGLFGNTNQAPAAGSLFGNQTTQAPGLFGNASATSPNPLFGNKTNLFGGQPAPGASTAGQNNSNSSTLFGQSTTTQPTSTLFGQSNQTKPAGSLFGSTTSGATGSLFGSTLGVPNSNNLLASRAGNASTPQQQADPQSQFQILTQRIEKVASSWDSRSPQCRFQHYFYNLVEPTQVSAFGRPPNATNETLWQRAVRENPDPTCLVPVLAVGFDDLRERVDAQSKQAAAQQEKLKELKKRLESLAALHQDSNVSRIQRAASLQSQISHRLLNLIQHLHLLIPAVRSSSIRPEEEALHAALEEIEEDIRRPGGMSKMRGKLNELWALVGAVNAARERGRKLGGPAEWTVVDEDGLKQIAQILADQQAGLQHLTKVLQGNLKDLAVVHGKNTEDEEMETLYSSTSTLRASTLR